ncbi:MrkB [Pantoea ananatis]|uniref:Fimbrial chaperone YehC n=1 Tax=Pantoea ananas TaxID=553 RepID=A0AAJ1CX42_PANAN|nr:molecular chaperone [Pantoea ananatis]KGL52643.1 MrkB [Pantoea ananatis]KTR50364.1 MrkB [Pantoea ananatis]KTR57820.1 MrkB [Pantoea ananatis]KTR67070.1 MrkB [Pantoea ananatis]KTR72010.1 MrkB [Pantoea ananatis]
MFKSIVSLLLMLSATLCQASVVLNGTRIIIDGSKNEKTIQFTNAGDQPALIQIQAVNPDANSTPPFVALPQIFRIAPNAGQTVKVKVTEKNVPQDRESLFYLDYTELPSVKKGDEDKNKLYLIIKNRVKVIVRPGDLDFSVDRVRQALSWRIQGHAILLKNASPFYANIRSFVLVKGNNALSWDDAVTLAPFSEQRITLKGHSSLSGYALNAILINDFGADEKINVNEK